MLKDRVSILFGLLEPAVKPIGIYPSVKSHANTAFHHTVFTQFTSVMRCNTIENQQAVMPAKARSAARWQSRKA